MGRRRSHRYLKIMTTKPPATARHDLLRFRRWLLPVWAALGGGILAGCAVGRDYKRPAPPQDAGYTTQALTAETASAPGPMGGIQRFVPSETVSATWWQDLGSAKLSSVVEQALRSSPTLVAAAATLRQANQTYAAQAGATQIPQANARLSAQRQGINTASAGLPDGERVFNLYHSSVEVSYNFDLFGSNRRTLEALAAQADYQRYQLAGARLSLAGDVVTTAITQARLAAQIQASAAILADQEAQLAIARQRVMLGAAAQNEVSALQTQVELTRADIPPLRTAFDQTRHLLAVLLGQTPGTGANIPFSLSDFTLPASLPVIVPSALVRQRPDIQAAEALLRAANAEYGVAVAKFYPQIALSGNLGSQALTTASLFDGGSLVWGLAGQLTQPLFRSGLRAEARAADAGFDAAAANYRQTVLQALRNVADVLRALDNDAHALKAQTTADAAAQEYMQSTRRQYDLGAASYLQVLVAQQQVHQIRISLSATQARRLLDTVALYQALGGGSPSDAEGLAAN